MKRSYRSFRCSFSLSSFSQVVLLGPQEAHAKLSLSYSDIFGNENENENEWKMKNKISLPVYHLSIFPKELNFKFRLSIFANALESNIIFLLTPEESSVLTLF